MKKFLLLFCALIFGQLLWSQVTLHVTSVPENTPLDANIYFVGTLNNWNPGDENYILQEHPEGGYFIALPEGTGTVEFKFTRGSWTTVEGNEQGNYRPNRSFTYSGQTQTLVLEIESWEDLGVGGGSTAADNVYILENEFYIPQLDRYRRIMLYLPPDYYSSTKTYPVIYMHDGQNLFDNQTAFAGEWEVDETLNALHDAGDWGAIVVGINNGGDLRIDELTPWSNPQYGGGDGQAYMDFIVETLKPHIDAEFRTKPEPENTALIGSSLGGLISTYGGIKFNEVFGKVGALSPSYWFNNTELMAFVANPENEIYDLRIAMVGGETESSNMSVDISALRDALIARGVNPDDILVQIDADGAHSEWYWRREFGDVYQWLFAEETISTVETRNPENLLKFVFPSSIYSFDTDISSQKAIIYTVDGRWVTTMTLVPGMNTVPQHLPAGVYFLNTTSGKLKFVVK